MREALLTELWDRTPSASAPSTSSRGERGVEDTIVSFAPLLDFPDLPKEHLDVCDLRSASFHPDRPADGFVVPSDLLGEGFDERRYWRGPVWIDTNWLLWSGLHQHGQLEEADEMLVGSLRLVKRSGFHEYFDPFDGAASRRLTASAGRPPDPRSHRTPAGVPSEPGSSSD